MYETYPDPSFNSELIRPREIDWSYSFKVKTPPICEPITLDFAKKFGRLDSMDEDDLIEAFITGARQAAEEYLGRALIQQTVVMQMDFWPGVIALVPRFLATSALPVPLPRPPLVQVTDVRTLNEDGTILETWDITQCYWLDGDRSQLVIKKGSVPPINVERYRGGFEVEYTAGYADPASKTDKDSLRNAVPMPIKLGIALWTAALYSMRNLNANEPPPEAKPLLDPYKVIRI